MGKILKYREDLDQRFINKVFGLKSFYTLAGLGMSKDYLLDMSAIYAFDIMKQHAEKSSGEIPPFEYVMLKLEQRKDEIIQPWSFEEEKMSMEGLIDELKNRYYTLNLTKIQKTFTEMLVNGEKAETTKNVVMSSLQELDFTSDGADNVAKFSEMGKRAQALLDRLKGGEDVGSKVIPFPFKKLNDVYGGMREKDLIFVVAPQKTGKTFILNEFAIGGFMASKKVLFISPEMSQAEILERIDGRVLGINYSKISNLNLNEEELQKYQNKIQDYQRIIESGGDIILIDKAPSGFSLDFVLASIERHQPDLIIIDGLTLLTTDSKESSDWLAAKKISERIKNSICNAKQVPVVVAVQAQSNDETANTEVMTSENVARAKQIVQDCDIAFGLSKSKSRGPDKRVFSTIDARRGQQAVVGLHMGIGEGKIHQDDDLTQELVNDYKDIGYV